MSSAGAERKPANGRLHRGELAQNLTIAAAACLAPCRRLVHSPALIPDELELGFALGHDVELVNQRRHHGFGLPKLPHRLAARCGLENLLDAELRPRSKASLGHIAPSADVVRVQSTGYAQIEILDPERADAVRHLSPVHAYADCRRQWESGHHGDWMPRAVTHLNQRFEG